jgi:serine/threonine protein kinase
MSETDPPTPPALADFEILELIGRGTFGTVWLAKERVTGVYRAIKVFPETAQDTEITGLCEYQRRALSHPHLIPVYLVGRHEDTYFVVMELADDIKGSVAMDPKYYEPCNLDRLLKDRGAFDVDEAGAILHDMLDAEDYLHSHGLVHRDIKPANVLFVDGRAKLCDFGLISPGHRAVDRAGTYGYWRPDGPTDRGSDLYATTKVAYQLFTGSNVSNFPELPATLSRSATPKQYELIRDLLDKGCAANPKRRFTSAQAMMDHTKDICPASTSQSYREPERAHKRQLFTTWSSGALIVTLLATAALSGWMALTRQAPVRFDPLAEMTLTIFPADSGNPNSLTKNDPEGSLGLLSSTLSTTNAKLPPRPIRYAKMQVAVSPASHILVFWISPSGFVHMNPSEGSRRRFQDPLRDAFLSLDGEEDNYVICAFFNDRPFKDRHGLKEAIQRLAGQYRDENPNRLPLPQGVIRVLRKGEVRTIAHRADLELNGVTGDFGLLGEIHNHFGPSYAIEGFELPLPSGPPKSPPPAETDGDDSDIGE